MVRQEYDAIAADDWLARTIERMRGGVKPKICALMQARCTSILHAHPGVRCDWAAKHTISAFTLASDLRGFWLPGAVVAIRMQRRVRQYLIMMRDSATDGISMNHSRQLTYQCRQSYSHHGPPAPSISSALSVPIPAASAVPSIPAVVYNPTCATLHSRRYGGDAILNQGGLNSNCPKCLAYSQTSVVPSTDSQHAYFAPLSHHKQPRDGISSYKVGRILA
jgi:hypothetical protein